MPFFMTWYPKKGGMHEPEGAPMEEIREATDISGYGRNLYPPRIQLELHQDFVEKSGTTEEHSVTAHQCWGLTA
jgi:hypothetical protein